MSDSSSPHPIHSTTTITALPPPPPPTPSRDSNHVVYSCFFLGGIAMLLPWNALITADEYFRRKFKGTDYADNFQNYTSLGFTVVNLIALAFAVKFQGRFTTGATEILVGLAVNILAFTFLTITALHPIGTSTDFFFVTQFLVLFSAVGTSYMQNGMFGTAARFPPNYILAIMSGQGVAGLAVAISSIISAWINADKTQTDAATQWSGFYYFFSCTIVLVISAGCFVLLRKNPFYVYYTIAAQDEYSNTSSDATANSSFEESEQSGTDHRVSLLAPKSPISNLASSSSIAESEKLAQPKKSMLQISWQIRSYALSCFLTFVVTLAVFPPLTSSVTPRDKNADKTYKALFVPLHFLLFNLGDWMGRALPSIRLFHIVDSKAIFIAACLRVLFVVGFVFCNNGESNNVLPDWTFFLLIIFFSMTNGWLGSLTMMAGPANVHPVDSSVAGTLMSFYLTIGLSVGAMLSFLIRWLVCKCNPFLS